MTRARARGSALLLPGLLALAAGCIPQGVPAWAMHVQPAKTDPSRNPDDVARNVQHELARKKLLHDHTSPEEIAVVAVRELQRGRLADAQLWLSVASYRDRRG
jgi:hypothetical protein